MIDIRGNISYFYDFYQTAKSTSYNKAALNTYISQSSISRKMTKLESNLGIQLFLKTNKGISLTLEGERLYKILDEAFSKLDLLNKNLFNNNAVGTITIGSTRNIADYKIGKILSEFNKKYPNIKIKIFTDSASNLNDYLTKRSINVLIDYLPHINYSEKFEFEVKAIGEFNTCFACSKSFFEKYGNEIKSLKDLKKFKLVIPGNSRRRQMLDEVLQVNNIVLEPQVEMPDSKLMVDFISETDSIGYFVEDELENTNLVKLDLSEKMPTNPLGIIYPKNSISDITKLFVDFVLYLLKY
ncbi:MAG: LysR family transcriptional regulator [Bacilli bacterium]|nr:LysR family transcriptional regulator [Bacilli bacterium]